MNQHNLVEIQNLPIAELADRLSGLSADELAQLRQLELDGGGRKGALEAIDAAAAVVVDDPPASPPVDSNLAKPDKPEAAAKEDPPAWQARDYTGPLDIEQMDWRNRNIKPVRKVDTK